MKRKSIFFAILGILTTVFIISNSLKTAPESNAMSDPIVEFSSEKLSFFFGSIDTSTLTKIVRKTAHVTEFFIQSFFISLAYFFGNSRFSERAINVAFFGLITACADELVQNFVSERGCLVTDIWIDFIGVVVAIALFFILCFFSKRKHI